jgi:uncharacterized protein YukE/predicted double-glycine peptidase
MPTLHLEAERGHLTGQALRSSGSSLAACLQELASATRRLDSAWQGGDGPEFSFEMAALLRRLNDQQDELDLLATRLEREISEWENVDQRGASSWQGGRALAEWLAAQVSLPVAGGQTGGTWPASIPILPLMTAISIGEFIGGLPAWLKDLLDKWFPAKPIISPLPDEDGQGKTGSFGDLLKKQPPTQPPATETGPSPEASGAATTVPPATTTPAEKFDILYDVPAESQGNLYGSAACSPTSVSMVLNYFHNQDPNNQTVPPDKLISLMDKGDGTPGQGVSLTNLTDELDGLGYKHVSVQVNASLEDLKSQLQNGPVIVTAGVKIVGPGSATADVPRAVTGPGSTMHAMVVKGINADTVVVNDPWSGSEMRIPIETFSKMWSKGSGGLYAIHP